MKVLDSNTGNLLRAVVRARDETRDREIAAMAGQITRWEDVIEAARQHGILPRFYSELAASKSAVPKIALELARHEFERNAFHCLANAAELLDVLKVFEQAEIAAMPFKGIVLGASAYGDITMRTAGDLDLLIYYRDLLPATRMLKERGYTLKTEILQDGTPESEDYFEYHFERADDGMVLELRWRLELTQPRFKHELGMDWVWPQRRMIELAGAEVPNLDGVRSLLVLCMHGSKHGWSRLIWVCDVAKLLESEPHLDWDFAQREARRVGLSHCLSLGVLLAHSVTGTEVPTAVLRAFERDRTARRLAEFLQQHLVEEPGGLPGGRLPYNLQLLDFRDRAGVVLSPQFLRPNARDRAVVRLPRILEPLYYLIRPFRVLFDRASR